MSVTFQKNVEDFVCLHCGYFVKGTGYTNHCPQCLWSRHVDVHPGDRQERCRGEMEPIGIDIEKGEYVILFRCQSCHTVRRNKTAANDSFDAILELQKLQSR